MLWQSACKARRHAVWTLLDPEFMNKFVDICGGIKCGSNGISMKFNENI